MGSVASICPGITQEQPPKIMLGSREAPGLPQYASPKVTRYKVSRPVSTVRRAWGGSDCCVAGPPDFSTSVSPGERTKQWRHATLGECFIILIKHIRGRSYTKRWTSVHLFCQILTAAIAPINLKRATLTMSEQSAINHGFRIPKILSTTIAPVTSWAGCRRQRSMCCSKTETGCKSRPMPDRHD